MKLQVKCHNYNSLSTMDSHKPVVSLKVNMAQLEHHFKLDVLPASDVNKLFAVVRKHVKKTPMVRDLTL